MCLRQETGQEGSLGPRQTVETQIQLHGECLCSETRKVYVEYSDYGIPLWQHRWAEMGEVLIYDPYILRSTGV